MKQNTLAQSAGRILAGKFSPGAMSVAVAIIAPVLWGLLRRNGRGRGRRVQDVMVEQVLTVDNTATLAEAAQLMREGNVGVLPVMMGGRVTGLLTDRDIVVRAVAGGADPRTARVSEYATNDVVCARPAWGAHQASRVMAEHHIGRLPVVDDEDRLVGIVTLSSLALRSSEEDETLEAAQEVARRSARHG
jgi:CBS domain-containing protein